ncbi:TRAP transporter large permease [Aliiroseovarius sp. PrR006]|uniref:TRAP transporter large permease n=1 Tax=Aliiroseovarius sp. PrR006 TaxID=2706883 RepID=UPI0013D26608|nr:TRAP transporter large permease subunit [Aliiroseovarius sp. PrR006]NDW54279.1 TRAP transporter large permease subunit [Aliiroseovarius sp. PrR006]
MSASVILLAIIILLLALRQNIMIILAVAVSYMHLVWGDGDILYLLEDAWIAIDKEALLSIPMFILVGAVMTRGSIAEKLIDIAIALTRNLRGGLGAASILSCAVFAAISGSSPVTLLAVGAVLYPALLQQNYPKSYALGALTSGGTLGIIIPPSIPLIIFGIATETSIVDLFLAGLLPGLLLTGVMVVYSLWRNRNIELQPQQGKSLGQAIKVGGPALFMPILLLGGIYSGFFTPTESAAVALAYALVIEAFVHREIGFRDLYNIVQETLALLGSLIPIIAIAVSVNIFLAAEGVPTAISDWMQANMNNVILFILCLNILLLFVGTIMDTISALLILGPLLLPIANSFGIDPVHLGIIMVLNLEIGLLTPPMGLNLLVASGAFKESFGAVAKSVLPFIALMIAVLMIVSFVPWLSLAFL